MQPIANKDRLMGNSRLKCLAHGVGPSRAKSQQRFMCAF